MQKLLKKAALTAVALFICCSADALGIENCMRNNGSFGPMPPPPPPFGIHLLVKCQMDNLLIKTLAEMSNQSIETITIDLEESAPPFLLQKYGIEKDAFDNAMRAKIIEMVNTAQTDGQITESQALRIIEEINTPPNP